jgi:hypothetical protein
MLGFICIIKKSVIDSQEKSTLILLSKDSAHPPGVLRGLIYGMVGRIYRLCSHPTDRDAHLHNFYRHLLHQGYKPPKVLPIFTGAIKSITHPLEPAPRQQSAARPLFLELKYHPEDPPSRALQHIWQTTLRSLGLLPPWNPPVELTLLESKG